MSLEEDIQEEFDERFSEEDINKFKEKEILPQIVNKYDKRFDVEDVIRLIENNIAHIHANRYDKRFGAWSISILFSARIFPQKANKYKQKVLEIKKLVQAKVPAEAANQYETRFCCKDIIRLHKSKVTPEKAKEYGNRSCGKIIAFVQANIPPEKTNQYFPKLLYYMDKSPYYSIHSIEELIKIEESGFSFLDINWLNGAKISPEKAAEYDEKLNIQCIIDLIKNDISPEVVQKYNRFFRKLDITAKDIIDLIKKGISPEKANEYGPEFSGELIAEFCEKNISVEQAKKYKKRFKYDETILTLVKAGMSIEKAEKYNQKFSDIQLKALIKANISPEQIKEYPKIFDGYDLIELVEMNISAKQAKEHLTQYDKRFGSSIIKLIKAKAEEYYPRFNGEEITELTDKRISPEIAKNYDIRFFGSEIVNLIENEISSKEADKYNKNFRAFHIIILHKLGADYKLAEKEGLFDLLGDIINNKEVENNLEQFKILGAGASAAVLLKENIAWKFSLEIAEEYEILKKIQQKYKGNQKNVIKLIREPKEKIALEIEYIKGNSLENLIKESNSLSSEKVIKYSSDIMNGLIEMRQAGIWYHRDIRPANIIIDEEKDRAVIIDLGKATTDKNALQIDNSRFGAPKIKGFLANDLISLGQVIYYMATGEHIFAESESQTRTFSDLLEEINDYRNKVYADKSGELLKKHLKEIDETIEDKKVRYFIKACLTSKHYDYTKIKRMFKK